MGKFGYALGLNANGINKGFQCTCTLPFNKVTMDKIMKANTQFFGEVPLGLVHIEVPDDLVPLIHYGPQQCIMHTNPDGIMIEGQGHEVQGMEQTYL